MRNLKRALSLVMAMALMEFPMRNLKRALSLVMAMALIVGMMVISASAVSKDFTDAGEIDHTEAVNTMVALNVIDGKDDGSYFDPEGTLTRSEMAKVVAFVMNGGVEPNIGTKVIPTYSDIDNHWAEAYIEYCTSMGIIAGDGQGKFNPTGELTASQTAKMFLTAMGYDATVFGLVGANWETNTNRFANEAGLYKDLGDIRVSDPISRDDACQMAYNAIQAALMVRGWSQDVTTGNITERYELAVNDDGEPTRTLFSERFGGKVFIGTFEGNYATGDASAKGQINVYGRLSTDDGTSNGQRDRNASFPSDLDISNIGEQVKVLFKDGTGGVDNKPDKNDTIYGIYTTEALTVYNTTKGALQDADTSVNDGQIKFGDALYDVADTANIVRNYGSSSVYVIGGDTAVATYINNPANGLRVTSSDSIKFVCNEDGEIAKAYVLDTKIGEVTAVTATNIQIAGEASKKVADCVNAEDVAAGDIVRYADLYPSATRATMFYEDAQVVEGVVEAYNASAPTSVRIDGTWYKYNGHNSFTATASNYTRGQLTSANVGDTVSLILDGGSNYGAYKVVTGFNNYAVVTASDSILGTNTVKVLKADGSTGTYTNVEAADGGINFGTVADNNLYAYELRSESTKIALNAGSKATPGTGSYVSDNMTLTAGVTSVIVNADASVFLQKGTEWRVYTAAELNTFSFTGNLQYITSSGKVVAMAGTVSSFPTANTKNTSFGYVTGVIATQVNDSPVTELTIWNGTEDVALLVDGTATAVKGNFVRFPIVADGAVVSNSDVKVAASGTLDTYSYVAAKVKSYDTVNGLLITTTDSIASNGTVVDGSDYSYKLTADTVIIGVNTSDVAGSTVNVPVIYTQVYGKDDNNVIVVYENKGTYNEVVAIFVDENNSI